MKFYKKEFTIMQLSVLGDIIRNVMDCMEHDEIYSEHCEEKQYTDGGNFILSLNQKEYNALKQLKEKL